MNHYQKKFQKVIGIVKYHENVCAFILLITLAFAIYQSALLGYWRFDDGAHLNFVARYSPWQYFLQPSIAVQQSAHITPYNAFFYEINLALFGMEPKWHYAHQILILSATAFATYRLMRFWQRPEVSLLASITFLLGLPTLYVAHQLMTGHYSTGLLFSVLSLYFFVLGVRQKQNKRVLLGAVFYFLATTCKEVYVPLVLILPFIPVGDNLKTRLKASLSFIVITILYVLWRYIVLGQLVGGYIANPVSLVDRFTQLLNIPFFLMGWNPRLDRVDYLLSQGSIYLIAIFLFLVLFAFASYRRYLNWLLIFAALPLIFIPLWILTKNPGILSADRYLYLLWWACSILIAILVGSLRYTRREFAIQYVFSIGLFAFLFSVQMRESLHFSPTIKNFEILYRIALQINSHTALIPPNPKDYYHDILSGVKQANAILENGYHDPKQIVVDKKSLCENVKKGSIILKFDETCNCIKDVTQNLGENLAKIMEYEGRAVADIPLNFKLNFRDRMLHWELGPFTEGTYFVLGKGMRTVIPSRGEYRSGGTEPLHFRMGHESSDGRVALSPHLEFDMTKQSEFNWKGVSVAETASCDSNEHQKHKPN